MTLRESFANELNLGMFLGFGGMSMIVAIVAFPNKVLPCISAFFFILSYACNRMMKAGKKARTTVNE